jgi:hypothetical protein
VRIGAFGLHNWPAEYDSRRFLAGPQSRETGPWNTEHGNDAFSFLGRIFVGVGDSAVLCVIASIVQTDQLTAYGSSVSVGDKGGLQSSEQSSWDEPDMNTISDM